MGVRSHETNPTDGGLEGAANGVTEETAELVERVAALDICKAVLTACIRVPQESTAGRRRQEVAGYATTTAAWLRLADRMRALEVTRVAMEPAICPG